MILLLLVVRRNDDDTSILSYIKHNESNHRVENRSKTAITVNLCVRKKNETHIHVRTHMREKTP